MFKNVSKEEIIVPATMAHLKEVRDFIEHIGKKYRFSDKVINSFKLVVDEACTNIIRHGYLDIKDGKITVRAIIRRLSLTIAIIDQGRSFDPRQMKNPDLEKYVQIGKKGGLGIFMMRKLMDDIQYNLTSKGNELRLTKVREALQEPAWRAWWEGQSIRRRYFLLSFGMITLLTLLAMAYSLSGVDKGVRRDVFAESAAISRNFAETSWQPLQDGDDLILNENTKFLYESRPDLIKLGLIVDSADVVVAAWPDLNMVAEFQQFDITRQELVDTLGGVSIYQTTERDSQYFYFAAPVILKTVGGDPAGKVILKVSDAHIKSLINSQWLEIFATIVIGFLILIGLTGLLVTFITRPFHSLADWVRQVGRGQVDEDEIDIDSNDEIGEIAQAFNEMTGKFREAQLTLIEQQRLQKELQVAQEIQQMLLPDDFPDVVGYDIASYYQSAKEVGGDLFDFMEVDDHSIGICVADVSGKGIPGSLVMTMIRTSLRLETRGNKNPAEILTKVNGFVTDDIRKGMFVTMLYVILDSRERMVSFASAGHNPMILYRGKSTETFYLNPSGFPVGITLPDIALFGERIQADRIRLHPDDILILYTDGITEAMNPKRELYGEARFLAAIRKFGSMDVTEFVKAVKADILEFTQGYEQNDDITLVAIKENMAAVDVKVENFRELFDKTKGEKDKTIAEYCKEHGISPTTFYRYRRIYHEGGYDLLREMLHGYTNLGLRHMSIEVKTKMYDIIRNFPEFGPKKISDLLNTEEYNYTEVSPMLIYEELRRAKLNTKERREAFVKRGGKQRLKPPGTPLLTLDGEVLVGFRSEDNVSSNPFIPAPPPPGSTRARERFIAARPRPEEPSRYAGLDDAEDEAGDGSEDPVEFPDNADEKK